MKTILKASSLLIALAFIGCADKELDSTGSNLVTSGPMQGLNVDDAFSYETTKQVTVNLSVPEFLNSAVVSLYSKTGNQDSLALGKVAFDSNGTFSREITVSAATDSILIYSNYIGLTKELRLPVTGNQINFDYASYYTETEETAGRAANTTTGLDGQTTFNYNPADNNTTNNVTYNYLNNYNHYGKPRHMDNDVIDNTLLDDINNSLPEGYTGGIPVTHPEFLGKETDIILTEDADVWITFVSEGAGNRNSLGFYTYTLGNKPTSASQIEVHNIVFPNSSMVGSGGDLVPGNRVHLGLFPANTVISWFLVANGWDGYVVKDYAQIYYSNPELNPEAAGYKDHMVLLHDPSRGLNIFGFEDLYRGTGNSDDDFNDAVFYVKSNPATAISTDNVAVIAGANDADGDGVNDTLDEYPDDVNKAFNNYYPSENGEGTLAYEDLWPSQGDYDFNDLVTNYHYNLVTNGNNKVTQLTATYTITNIGASFHNGLAFVLPINPSLVASVSGQVLNGGYEDVAANGTEEGTASEETVIYILGDALHQTGETITVTVNFNTPIAIDNLGVAPYNTFLIANSDRSREVHLPNLAPTSKAQRLGTEDDASNATLGIYYKNAQNLPWALNIFDTFVPPAEKTPITVKYPDFVTWANSGGTLDLQWYKQ